MLRCFRINCETSKIYNEVASRKSADGIIFVHFIPIADERYTAYGVAILLETVDCRLYTIV